MGLDFVTVEVSATEGTIQPSDIEHRVNELQVALGEHTRRLEFLQGWLMAAMGGQGIDSSVPTSPSRIRRPARIPRSERRPKTNSSNSVPRGPGLHEEIASVLSATGGPMSAREIADAIRNRGRYRGRSTKPVSAALVSKRVSNPNYRVLFTRDKHKISLAQK
jgi:hypothetical protein